MCWHYQLRVRMTHKESHYMHDKQNTSLRDKSMVNAIHVLCILIKLMRSDIWIEMSPHQIFRISIFSWCTWSSSCDQKQCLIYFYWEQNSSLIRYKHIRKDTLFFIYACGWCRGCSNHCESDSNEILKINKKNIENTNVFTSFIYTICRHYVF